jgi:hypothetical protein
MVREVDQVHLPDEFHNEHNHAPPSRAKADLAAARERLKHGAKPAKLHQELVLEASPDDLALGRVPTHKQLKSLRTRLNAEKLPTNDMLANVIGGYGQVLSFFLNSSCLIA